MNLVDKITKLTGKTYIILKIFSQESHFQTIKSRKIYQYQVEILQESYKLQIKDGNNKYDFTVKEVSELFVRPRRTTLIWKHREFQFKLLLDLLDLAA